jgi:hypothetical protein
VVDLSPPGYSDAQLMAISLPKSTEISLFFFSCTELLPFWASIAHGTCTLACACPMMGLSGSTYYGGKK